MLGIIEIVNILQYNMIVLYYIIVLKSETKSKIYFLISIFITMNTHYEKCIYKDLIIYIYNMKIFLSPIPTRVKEIFFYELSMNILKWLNAINTQCTVFFTTLYEFYT